MRRGPAALGSALFFLVAPGTIAGLIPWWISGFRMQPAFLNVEAVRVLGGLLAAAGVATVLVCFARFVTEGRGTPAPVAAPERLVVGGLYRHVRNPIYVGVVSTVLGEALLLGDARLLAYAAAVWVGFHVFVLGYEEPTLRARFGDDYARFTAAVPRWLPRLRAWTPD